MGGGRSHSWEGFPGPHSGTESGVRPTLPQQCRTETDADADADPMLMLPRTQLLGSFSPAQAHAQRGKGREKKLDAMIVWALRSTRSSRRARIKMAKLAEPDDHRLSDVSSSLADHPPTPALSDV